MKTKLGEKLLEVRKKIVETNMRLFNWGELAKEVKRRRG